MGKGNQRYTVIVAPEAEAMLVEHARFLAKVREDAAEQLVADFLALVDSLETMPERFGAFAQNGCQLEGYHKALFAKRYLAIFCLVEQEVYLDFVVDCRRAAPQPLGELMPS